MNLNEWKDQNGGTPAYESLADSCDTSIAYLRQIESGHRKASHTLSRLIERHTQGLVTVYDLRPDIFGERPEAA